MTQGTRQEQEKKLLTSNTLYVGNLSFHTTEEQIHELFNRAGDIKRIIMGLDKLKKTPCGFCFVEYPHCWLFAVYVCHAPAKLTNYYTVCLKHETSLLQRGRTLIGRSRIWTFDWYQNWWPSMTLNGEMALILRYFIEFGSFRGALRKSGWQSYNYGQFTITVSSSKRLQRDRATPTL